MARLTRNVAIHTEDGEAIWYGPGYLDAEPIPAEHLELIPASFFEDDAPVRPKRVSRQKKTTVKAEQGGSDGGASPSDPTGLPDDLDQSDGDAVLAWVNSTTDPNEYKVRAAAVIEAGAEGAARLKG